jgi:SAM-dependent methyltransferase
LYERGWRQNFQRAGFPGIEQEFAEVQDFFSQVAGNGNGTVVDLSCGSGLMSRRLVNSGSYARVLALDFSEEMLKETNRRFAEESIKKDSFTLVRADAAALPLQSGSVDAIHAGAAMHCWPQLEASLAEVQRSLKSGGRFFATTFFEGSVVGVKAQGQAPGLTGFRVFKDEQELTDLLAQAGFSDIDVRREGESCAVIRAVA